MSSIVFRVRARKHLYSFTYALFFFLSLYYLAIRIYALFNDKAKKWIKGRQDWERHVNNVLQPGEKRVWVHASSVGEFEQAKPVIESIRANYPGYKIAVTFFSPSGYEACKNNALADYVFYLPHDSKGNAERFVAAVQPSLVMFVKYEFWYHYLTVLKKNRVPTLLVSGAFRPEQPFFKWYGGLFRKMLECFSFYFLQDEQSKKMLHSAGIDKNILISGDTRYDRVAEIAKNVTPIKAIEQFKNGQKIMIGGSTWPGDEDVLRACLPIMPDDWKLIIVPHEIDDAHIRKLQVLFGDEAVLFTELNAAHTGTDKKVLIVNNMGMLSRLYAYADVAFVGGGFHKAGIHNVLEPAVYGVPVVFGPVFEKFVEAKELAEAGYAFPINDAARAMPVLEKLVSHEQYRLKIAASLRKFMQEHTGATAMILHEIARQGWLQ